MLLVFISALSVGFSGAMMPGSLLTYTIQQSLSSGPRAGFIITLGHVSLELVLIVFIFLGLDIILQSEIAQIIIGSLGGLLLLYMGIDMIRHSAKNKNTVMIDQKAASSRNMFLSGIAISAANPYFLLWWAIIGLGFVIKANNSFGYIGIIVYFFGHIIADFIWYGTISVVVGNTRKFIKEKLYRIIMIILGCLLIFFGGKFVYDAVIIIIN